MKEASKITQHLIKDSQFDDILEQLPENWHLKLILLYYKDIKGFSWGKIYLKLGYVDNLGKPDKCKGQRLNAIYRRFKRSLEKKQEQYEGII